MNAWYNEDVDFKEFPDHRRYTPTSMAKAKLVD